MNSRTILCLALLVLSGCEREMTIQEADRATQACDAKGMDSILYKRRDGTWIRVECVMKGQTDWSTSDE